MTILGDELSGERDGEITSKGFLSGTTSTLATSAFLAAGAGAGVPQEHESLFAVDVFVSHEEEKKSVLDFVPEAGASNLKGSLLAAGAEVPQPLLLELVPKKSVVVLALVFAEEPNGSLASPQGELVVVAVPKGSVVLVVAVLTNGSLALPLANGSLLLVAANGSLELLLSQLNALEAGAGAGVSKPKPPDPPDVPNPADCCGFFFQVK